MPVKKLEEGHEEIIRNYIGPICSVCRSKSECVVVDHIDKSITFHICATCASDIYFAHKPNKRRSQAEEDRRTKQAEDFRQQEDRINSPG